MSFKSIAQKATSISPIMTGREKLSTEDIAGKVFTIIEFDLAPKFDKNGCPIVDDDGVIDTYGVVVFEEQPSMYYCVGTVFSKVCRAWAAEYESTEEASKELQKEGGVKVKFVNSKTKSGNNLTSVEIL